MDEVVAAGRALLAEQPRGVTDLGRALAERWPDRRPQDLAYAVHYLWPLVQLPPRAVCGQRGRAICAPLPGQMPADASPDELVVCYLRASARPRRRTCRSGPGSRARARSSTGWSCGIWTAACTTRRARRCPTRAPPRRRASCPTSTTCCSRTRTARGLPAGCPPTSSAARRSWSRLRRGVLEARRRHDPRGAVRALAA